MNGESSSVRAPRYVHLMKASNGYGFNLHGEKGVVGQYISAVDKGGSADIAGLCVGDRVVEVNGVNVEAATHAQVVARIKEDPERATMLVVDRVTDEYMKREGLPISGDFAKFDSVVEITRAKNEEVDGHGAGDIPVTNGNHTDARPVIAVNDEHVEAKQDQVSTKRDYTQAETPALTSQVSEEYTIPSQQSVVSTSNGRIESNGTSNIDNEVARTGMAAALPKPKRRTIKEEKTDNWAAKAALFNNL